MVKVDIKWINYKVYIIDIHTDYKISENIILFFYIDLIIYIVLLLLDRIVLFKKYLSILLLLL